MHLFISCIICDTAFFFLSLNSLAMLTFDSFFYVLQNVAPILEVDICAFAFSN